VILVIALERISRGRAAYHGAPGQTRAPARLRGGKAFLAFSACFAPVCFGFLLPVAIVAGLALRAETAAGEGGRTLLLAAQSFSIAGTTAFLAVAVAVLMAYALRLSQWRVVALANRTASLGYALPGAVIAVGVLVPLTRFDNALADLIEAGTGVAAGLIFTGTIVALIYAYLVRFLAIALQTVEAGLAKVTPSMDDAARSLGASPAEALRRIHAPLLTPSLAAAALLVFVDVLKELPATFALRPFNFDTLAIAAYHYAKDERLAEAALPSLVIVAIGLVPLVAITRRYLRATPLP
jgi:iron(III) transport system permease protein